MKKLVLISGIVVIVLGLLFFNLGKDENSENNNVDSSNLNGENNEELIMQDKMSKSPYIEFTKEAYDKAIAENKKILLYFYANWCPICRAEQPAVNEAFSELDDVRIIGFRVNYKDSDTDEYEEELAKEFGIAYQHTKVLLVNGEQVVKSLESWSKERYIEELNNI